jgi:protease IV
MSTTQQPVKVILQQYGTGRGWSTLWFLALLVSLGFNYYLYRSYHDYLGTDGGPAERFHSGSAAASSKIAVIRLEGLIADGEGYTGQQIEAVRNDPDVKAIVLRVDSPGGTVSASEQLYHRLKKLRDERQLPVVVSMGGVAASGGYYVAMAASPGGDTIFGEPSGIIGSIGVVIPHYSLDKLMARFEVADDSVTSHPLKTLGSPTKPMAPEERKILQELVDQMFAQFKDVVRAGRPALGAEGALEPLATGEVFLAPRAQALGLIDKVGYLEDAIARASALAGLDPSAVRVVEYEAPFQLGIELPFVESPDWTRLLGELNTPRGYFLYGGIPSARIAAQSGRRP